MRIGIVGLGLIGGSLAGAFRAAGHEVAGYDLDASTQRLAMERGFIDRAITIPDLAAESDVVVLCLPVEATIQAVADVAPLMRSEAILSDVASVKRPIIEAMNAVTATCTCVGGHPIAGKEISGIEGADANLFRGAAYALVPSRKVDSATVDVLKGLVAEIGAHPLEIDGEGHDAMLARTSHLAQAVSSALSLYLDGARDDDLKGPGIKGMLRLARSDEHLWSEIFTRNSDNVGETIRGFIDTLRRFAECIESKDTAEIEMLMRKSREALP